MDFTQHFVNTSSSNVTDPNTSQSQTEDGVDIYKMITVAAQAIIIIVICFGNGLVITAFYRFEQIQTITNYYIMHLAVADLTVGLTLPFHIASFLKPEILNDIYVCIFRYSTLFTTQSVSVLCLLAITIDRYSAVIYPMRYHSLMTKRRTVVTILAVWVIPLVPTVLVPFLWHNPWPEIESESEGVIVRDCDLCKVLPLEYHRYISVPAFTVVTVIVVGLYCKIFHVARQHAAQIEDMMASVTHSSDPHKMSFNVNYKIAKTAAIVLGLFILFMAPFFFILAVQVYSGLVSSELWIEVRVYAGVLALLNSGVNPVVYAYRLPEFRRGFRKILHLKPGIPTDHESIPSDQVIGASNRISTLSQARSSVLSEVHM